MMGTDVPLHMIAQATRGALGVELTEAGLHIRRLPAWTVAQYADDRFLDVVTQNGSGVRLDFETTSSWIELGCRWDVLRSESVTLPLASLVVEINGTGTQAYPLEAGYGIDLVDSTGRITQFPGRETRMRLELPGAPTCRAVTVWLPQSARVTITGARSDAALAVRATAQPRWLHYGSSISQCNEAPDPLGAWPVLVARRLGLDLTNLGLAGQAHLDQFVARTIRDAEPDLITLKVGINMVAAGTMKARTLRSALHGFLDTIRESLPTTPITVISPIFSPDFETTPGPSHVADLERLESGTVTGDDRLTLRATRQILRDVATQRMANDQHLGYLDGTALLDSADIDLLPDRVHPNPTGYRAMAERFVGTSTSLPGFAGLTRHE
ncbi:GDSL-type esterase/lipase family protein [Microbacterium rhizosphaerae]|uniref:SGNH/GDSL hydrolase family protein n=1 Tax=Microbacterium rhizosphaerae TaxID=1678237 RepID=A0ABZ0SPC9_9MICO|nr:GDSL-type esterase/lipase family protein [Microbacterium rhizosphaerae]WPR89131.1 SGNH/GDSL hydrolase family protein [Microbacterium rhizosphaerae]